MKQNNKEIWVSVPGYKDYYQVSDEGRVRSLSRTMLTKNGQERFYKGKIMEGSFNKEGYRQVTLSRDGKQETFLIHQAVAICFLGHIPNGSSLVIDHINGVKTDNRVKNLQIVTHRNNVSICFRKDRNSLSSDFLGVYRFRNKWTAKIYYNSKLIHLGYFDNELEASDAYQKALGELENGTFDTEDYRASFTSNYKGVTFNKASQKWVCQPHINGKQVYLGRFDNELEAHQTVLLFESAQPIVKNS